MRWVERVNRGVLECVLGPGRVYNIGPDWESGCVVVRFNGAVVCRVAADYGVGEHRIEKMAKEMAADHAEGVAVPVKVRVAGGPHPVQRGGVRRGRPRRA